MSRPRRPDEPLRILHLDHARALGGAERSIMDLAVAQRQLGHEAIVGLGRAGDFATALDAAGVPWQSMDWPWRAVETGTDAGAGALLKGALAMLGAARAVRRTVAAVAPDVVVAHTRKAQLAAALGLAATRVPLVWHFHDAVPPRALVRIPVRLASLRANGAVALSAWHGDEYAAARLPARVRPVVAGDCVDLAPLEALAPGWPQRSGRPVVGFVGSISRMKAPDLFVAAADLLPAGAADFVLFGMMQFPETEAAFGAQLDATLAAPGHPNPVTLRGQAPSAAAAFAEFDILVHCSSLPEPFGRVIIEAMAAGRPIVAFRRGAPAEILDDTCAAFAPSPDAPGIAAAVARLTADPARAAAMAERARQRVGAYRPAVLAARLDAYYRTLL